MSEYIIHYKDAETLYEHTDFPFLLEEYLREEIIRCRDCVHYKPYMTHRHGMMNRCYDENGHTHKRDESDFCSRGERRGE